MKQVKVLNWNVVDSEGDSFSIDEVEYPEKPTLLIENSLSKIAGKFPLIVKNDGLYFECTETLCKQYVGYFPSIVYQRIKDSKIRIHHLSLNRRPNMDKTIKPI